jgi:hypothetical protein
MEQRIYNYSLMTLVDITKTNQVHNSENNDDLKRNQHRNYQTMLQTLGLRTQPTIKGDVKMTNGEFPQPDFGESYNGIHNIWQVNFSVEQPEAFSDTEQNPVGLLEEDFDQVPIVSMLKETARFILPCFFSYGPLKNIHFYYEYFDRDLHN